MKTYDNIYLGGEQVRFINKIRWSGRDLILGIPKDVSDKLDLNKGEQVELSVKDGKIIIEKVEN